MSISGNDIKFMLTGGTGNTNPNLSLGGEISSTELVSSSLHNLFDKVTGDESLAGDTEYRCFGIKNSHATLTWEAVKVFISANTQADDSISIAVEKPISGVVQTIENESTAPLGTVFSSGCIDRSSGLDCTSENGAEDGEIIAGEWAGIWVCRVVPPDCSPYNNTATIGTNGDTPA